MKKRKLFSCNIVIFVETASSNRSNKDSENQPIKGGTIMDMDEEATDKLTFLSKIRSDMISA